MFHGISVLVSRMRTRGDGQASMKRFKAKMTGIGHMLWPNMGWRRLGRYLWHRLTRLKASPHAIALGVAFGVFASFTPLMGFHIALASVLAYMFGGNLIAAGLGTLFGNPLTFPFIWLVTYNVGGWFLGAPLTSGGLAPSLSYSGLFSDSLSPVLPVLTKMMLGSLPLGLLVALICYFPLKIVVAGLQQRRRHRVTGKAKSGGKAAQLATSALS